MYKATLAGLFMAITISIAGCTGMLSVPDSYQLVSNYRTSPLAAQDNSCDIHRKQADAQTAGLNPRAIRLLNWNVYKGEKLGWDRDFQQLSRQSDIVVLQEAQLHPSFIDSLSLSSLNWDLTTAFTYDGAETGVLMASNTRPVAVCALHAMEPLISIPKSALVNQYRIDGSDKTLMVANIHMINFTLGTDEYRQQLDRLKSMLTNHSGPMIVTGDFNTWNDERMLILVTMVRELGLTAVEYDNDYRMTVFGNPLDHIFYRGLDANMASTRQVNSSDHNPLMVTFRLPASH